VEKDYTSAADTTDLTPAGTARAARQGGGSLAYRDPEMGSLEVVTKCISGFTDKFYAANKEKYAERSSNSMSRPSHMEYSGSYPDVWFEPQEVWEMAFADITLSSTYTVAVGLVSRDCCAQQTGMHMFGCGSTACCSIVPRCSERLKYTMPVRAVAGRQHTRNR
jgi:DNA ligase 1